MMLKIDNGRRILLGLAALALLMTTAACGPEDADNNDAACTPTNGGVEICDDIDNDCNGEVDDGAEDATEYYNDGDGDGFGADSSLTRSCDPLGEGYITQGGDCDDENADINPDADEVCDDVDNNCDGDKDMTDVQPQACQNQTGVCADGQTTTCDAGEYAMCSADDFGDMYSPRADEGWMCDGLDNNCDGTADEACCTNGDAPQSSNLATAAGPGTEFPFDVPIPPAFAPAAGNAPDDAEVALAWISDESTIKLQHFDAMGGFVGDEQEASSPQPINSLTLLSKDSGYELIWSSYQQTSGSPDTFTSRLNAQSRLSDLTDEDFPVKLVEQTGDATPASAYTELDAANIDGHVAIGWVEDTLAEDGTRARSAGALKYMVDDRGGTVTELQLQSGDSAEAFTNVNADAHDGDFLFTWAEPAESTISGRVFATDGTAGTTFDIARNDLVDTRIDTIATGEDTAVIFGSESGLSGSEIVATTVDLASGAETDDTELAVGEDLSAAGADLDGDGFADRVSLVWRKTGGTDDQLVTNNLPTDSLGPSMDTEVTLLEVFDSAAPPTSFRHDIGVGIGWFTSGTDNRDIIYAPFSADGPGICPVQ